jgi:hypothetical protein
VWSGVGKLCRSTLNTIPIITQAVTGGIAISEIAITAEGIPVRLVVPKVVECMEITHAGIKNVAVKVEKVTERVHNIIKMRGKHGRPYQKISVQTQARRPLSRLKGKNLRGIKNVSVGGYESLSKRIVLDNYQHYLQPELRVTANGKLTPSGWHHDLARRIEKIKRVNGHKIEIEKYQKHFSGIYRFDWGVEGMSKKTSTFFPHIWSRATVQRKIVEAYKYARKYHYTPQSQPNGKFSLIGFTKEGIEVKIIIDQKGIIVTAYPVWPE